MAHDTFFFGLHLLESNGTWSCFVDPVWNCFPFFFWWEGWGGLRYSLSECAALFWWISPLLLRPFGLDLPVFQPPQSSVADG